MRKRIQKRDGEGTVRKLGGERGRTRRELDITEAKGGESFKKKTVTNITELTGKGGLLKQCSIPVTSNSS